MIRIETRYQLDNMRTLISCRGNEVAISDHTARRPEIARLLTEISQRGETVDGVCVSYVPDTVWDVVLQFGNLIKIGEDITPEAVPDPVPEPSNFERLALEIAARCWCDPETEGKTMDVELAKAFAARVQKLADGMELAWGVIANVHDWDAETPEWKAAAERWRDEVWHPLLEGKLC